MRGAEDGDDEMRLRCGLPYVVKALVSFDGQCFATHIDDTLAWTFRLATPEIIGFGTTEKERKGVSG